MRNVGKIATLVVLFAMVLALLYFGSRPLTYNLNAGDTSPYDIVAPRNAVDTAKTEQRALDAYAQVPTTWMRSEPYSKNIISRMQNILAALAEKRTELYGTATPAGTDQPSPPSESPARVPSAAEIQQAVSSLISNIDQNHQLSFAAEDMQAALEMAPSRYENFRDQVESQSNSLMSRSLDQVALENAIRQTEEQVAASLEYYQEDAAMLGRVLRVLLRPNVVSNREATDNARQAAYDRVINNPVLINRGTRIVSQGEVITAETYQLLDTLELTSQTRFDWKGAAGLTLLTALLFLLSFFYFRIYQPDFAESTRNLVALGVALLVPLAVTMLLAKSAPLAAPVYFAAVVICAYFGFRTAFFMTVMLTLAILPMVMFEPAFPLIGLAGATMAALYTKGIGKHDRYAKIILMSAFATFAMTVGYGLMTKQTWLQIGNAAIETTVSAIVSVIAAIGIMPLFELIFNTVSPLRLIELSQPGHVLLKRLFVEAPGTSQHSMMVANLADAAAEAIGANAMIARVGAYYHDIGKLENPLMFVENQLGVNPHDELTPAESVDIIRRHPEDGLKIARRHRLPQPVLRIIHEHHGTTVMQYFYRKAQELAEQIETEPPNADDYRYRTTVPSSRESAIVMLADATEATVKAQQIDTMENAETIVRNVIRTKVEQDQLVESQLSFRDVETITLAFLQVYAGHFHERVQYPHERETA